MNGRAAKWLVIMTIAATPLRAEHAWSELFDGRLPIYRTGDTERVELEGGVTVSRHREDGGWAYRGADFSEHGAAGCVALILLEIEAMNRMCSGLLDDAEKATLTGLLRRAAAFYEANAIPPVSEDVFLGSVEHSEMTAASCTGETAQFAKSVLSEQFASEASAAFDVPRLPVINPCL